MSFWSDRKVLVPGGEGFLGSSLVQLLEKTSCELVVPSHREYDFRLAADVERVLKATQPDIVFNLAARVGGIGLNLEVPGELFYDNLMIGTLFLEYARRFGVAKYVAVGTVCCYPKFTHVPFREEDLWEGYPEETNAAYGLAKKMQLVQSAAYRQQYGFNSIFLIPTNLYGPGDKAELGSSHVIPALIRKFLAAKENGGDEVVVWGTGRATREFLYVDDCAEALVLAAERYDKSEPVNLGSGRETSIRELAGRIRDLVGFEGKIVWDRSKPDGQPRRRVDTSKAEEEFGFKAKTDFDVGLKKTVEWYRRNLPARK